MKTCVTKDVRFTAMAETPKEREIFVMLAISDAGVRLHLADSAVDREDVVLTLRDSLSCAVLANLVAVAHRRMQEIELANTQTSTLANRAGPLQECTHGASAATAAALGAPHPAPV